MTTTTTPALTPGTHATVTRTITDTWAGDIPAGTVVTVVEFTPEDCAADLGDGRIVFFLPGELAPGATTAPADTAEEHNCTCGAPDSAHCPRCWFCPGKGHENTCGW